MELPHTFENLDHYLGNPIFALETNLHTLKRDIPNFCRENEDVQYVARLVQAMERSINKMKKELDKAKKAKKQYPLCPYKNHADDCDCQGMGGDR